MGGNDWKFCRVCDFVGFVKWCFPTPNEIWNANQLLQSRRPYLWVPKILRFWKFILEITSENNDCGTLQRLLSTANMLFCFPAPLEAVWAMINHNFPLEIDEFLVQICRFWWFWRLKIHFRAGRGLPSGARQF